LCVRRNMCTDLRVNRRADPEGFFAVAANDDDVI